MKHNTIFKSIIVALAVAPVFCSCDDISDNDRYIALPAVEANRTVLLEEFTGQLCINCPEAHVIIADLLNLYPDNLIAVSIHGGGDVFSYPETHPRFKGLRNDDGQAYCDSYNIPALPAGVVNRKSGVLQSGQWAGAIRSEIERPTDIDMQVTAVLSQDGSKAIISTSVTPYDNIEGHLQLWVVESGIEARQITPAGYDNKYIHNHVFRGVINGHDGESVRLVTRETQAFTHELDIRDIWDADNLAVVAFVYNSDGVLQACETEIEKQ